MGETGGEWGMGGLVVAVTEGTDRTEPWVWRVSHEFWNTQKKFKKIIQIF